MVKYDILILGIAMGTIAGARVNLAPSREFRSRRPYSGRLCFSRAFCLTSSGSDRLKLDPNPSVWW